MSGICLVRNVARERHYDRRVFARRLEENRSLKRLIRNLSTNSGTLERRCFVFLLSAGPLGDIRPWCLSYE